MKTAMLSLHALVLLLVVGRLPDGQGAHAADDVETAAKVATETSGETNEAGEAKKATAEGAAEIRGLIPKASAMAREDFEKLARSTTTPRTSDLENKSLSLMLFTLRGKEQFQFRFHREFSDERVRNIARRIVGHPDVTFATTFTVRYQGGTIIPGAGW